MYIFTLGAVKYEEIVDVSTWHVTVVSVSCFLTLIQMCGVSLLQLEFEKSQVKKFGKRAEETSSQLEEELPCHKQLSSMLVRECKKATSKAAEEGQKAGELSLKLEKEKSRGASVGGRAGCREEVAADEAQVEKQLSEFDIGKGTTKSKAEPRREPDQNSERRKWRV